MPVVASIPTDILLSIADHADAETIAALMFSCKGYYNILREYEMSVVKTKLCRCDKLIRQPAIARKQGRVNGRVVLDESTGHQHARQRFVAPNGTVLTSHTPEREVAKPYSFSVVKELQLREARIQALLGPGGLFEAAVRTNEPFGECGLGETEVAALADRLERACRLTDRLADCIADVMVRLGAPTAEGCEHLRPTVIIRHSGWTPAGNTSVPDRARNGSDSGSSNAEYPSSSTESSPAPAAPAAPVLGIPMSSAVDLADSHEQANLPSCSHASVSEVARAVRQAQLDLLRSLPLEDLIFLADMVGLAGTAYQALHQEQSHSDPDFWERVTAFQETVLRQGAGVALCGAFLVGLSESSPMSKFVEEAVRGVLRELRAWETAAWPRAFYPDDDQAGHHDEGGDEGWSDGVDTWEGNGGEGATELLPGLQMTVWGAIREKAGWEDDGMGRWMDGVVLEAIRGPAEPSNSTKNS